MNRREIEDSFQLMSQKINNNIGLMDYSAAGTNMRILTETICEVYLEINDLELDSDVDNLSGRLDCLKRNNVLNRNTLDTFYLVKNIGNSSAHEVDAVTKEEANNAWKLLQKEMDKLLEVLPGDDIPTGFNSLVDEGWHILNESAINREINGDEIIETIIHEDVYNVIGIPQFYKDFASLCNIPSFPLCLNKRIIKQDTIDYECEIVFKSGLIYDEGIDVTISIDKEKNEVINFWATYEHYNNKGEKLLYEYDKYQRIYKGYWYENREKLIKKACKFQNEKIESLSIFSNPDYATLFLPEECMNPFNPILCGEKFIVYDDKYNYCVFNCELNYTYDKNDEEKVWDTFKYNIEPIVVKQYEGNELDTSILEETCKDVFRLQYIKNGLLTYLGKTEDIVDISDFKSIWGAGSGPACCFIEGYDLFSTRENGEYIIGLADTYTKNITTFSHIKTNDEKEYSGLVFDYSEIAFDFKGILDIVSKGDISISKEKINNYSEEAMIEALRNSIRYSPKIKEGISFLEKKIAEDEEKEKYQIERERIEQERIVIAEKKKQVEAKKKENNKKKAIIITIAVIAVVVILLLPCIFAMGALFISSFMEAMPKNINVNDYVEVDATGYNHCGKAVVTFDEEKFHKDYGKKIKFNEGWYSKSGLSAVDSLMSDFDYSIENDGSFSNGDILVLEWNIDEQLLKDAYNCNVEYSNIVVYVDGLEETEEFDAFEDFQYELNGVSSEAELNIISNLNSKGYFGLLYKADKTEGIKNGDIITVSVVTENSSELSEYCLERFDALPSETSYTIEVAGLPEYVNAYTDITNEKLREMIDYGSNHFKEMYSTGSRKTTYRTSFDINYIGNYFYKHKESGSASIAVIYKMTDRLSVNDSTGENTVYLVLFFNGIYKQNGEIKIDYDKVTDVNNEIKYVLGSRTFYYTGFGKYEDIYSNIVKNNEEKFYIQNNMNE
jgi:hypothetical protein